MKTIAIIAVASLGVAANALTIIDDFSTAYTKTITSGSWVDSQIGTFVGGSGERDVEMRVISNPLAQQLDLTITGSQLAVVSNGFGTLSKVSLQYDAIGDEAGNTGANKFLTNGAGFAAGTLAGETALVVRFLGNDLDLDVTATLRRTGGIISQMTQTRAGGSGIGDMVFNFGGTLGDADSLTFEFNSARSGDFALEGIEAVPEPATMVTLGLGLAAALRRRNRK